MKLNFGHSKNFRLLLSFGTSIFLFLCASPSQSVAVLLALHLALASAFTFNIDANREECFYEQVNQGDSVGIMFNVVSGGFLDINLQVRRFSHSNNDFLVLLILSH